MADAGGVLVERDGGLLRLTLDRPEARNALSPAMYDALRHAMEDAGTRPDIVSVLISAAGKDFCAGNDADGFMLARTLPKEERPGYRFMRCLAAFPKPIIAAVSGRAIGIGATMMLHCDLVYLSPEARFQMPFSRLGLVPEFASSFLLPRMAGHARAADWLMLGHEITADAAVEIGLATAVVRSGTVLDHALDVAREIDALPGAALREIKRLMRAPVEARIAAIMDGEMTSLSERLNSDETAALIEQFGRGRSK